MASNDERTAVLARLSSALLLGGALALVVGGVGRFAVRTGDVRDAMERVQSARGMSQAVVELVGFGVMALELLGSDADRAVAEQQAHAHEVRLVEAQIRDGATWRAFREHPPAGEPGVRTAAICPSPSPPDPSRCLGEAQTALALLWQERQSAQERFGWVALSGFGLVAIGAALRVWARWRLRAVV